MRVHLNKKQASISLSNHRINDTLNYNKSSSDNLPTIADIWVWLQRVLNHWPLILTLLIGVLGLSACSDQENAITMYDNYLYRLHNVTNSTLRRHYDLYQAAAALPAKRQRLLATTDVRVNLLDFLQLAQCDLLHQVSERNSSLGKVQAPSARLLYESKFIKKLNHCVHSLAQEKPARSNYREQLEKILDIKQSEFGRVFWNATGGAEEFNNLLSPRIPPLPNNSQQSSAQLSQSLKFFATLQSQIQQPDHHLDLSQLESHYALLQQNKFIGQLINAIQLNLIYLEEANKILRHAKQRNLICPLQQTTREGEHLFNVFQKFFAAEIQIYVSKVHRHGELLLPPLNQLFNNQRRVAPASFNIWFQQYLDQENPEGNWQRFQFEFRQHVELWQSLLTQCQLMPTRAPQPETAKHIHLISR